MLLSAAAHRTRALHNAILVLGLLTLGSCGKDEKGPVAPLPPGTQAPDFSLIDRNPNSATAGQAVSPRQKLNKISAWYFGTAT